MTEVHRAELEEIARLMAGYARQEEGVLGVAIAAIAIADKTSSLGYRDISAICATGVVDGKYNCEAIALGKYARALRVCFGQGGKSEDVLVGELPYRGAIISPFPSDRLGVCVFSGGTEDEDVRIALLGIRALDSSIGTRNRLLATYLGFSQ